jgi:predicted  nucleic acid-binding Zn-ribbon protein
VSARKQIEREGAAAGGSVAPPSAETQSIEPQLLRRGSMDVEVEKLSDAQARLERAVASLAGQVARLEAREGSRAEYSLRVPAARLDALMDSAAAVGKVESRTVTVQDVTEQVIDTEARLSALRASRDRLRQLLDRASSVQDVVAVERELARVQGDVESLEARLTALRGQVRLSELSVSLHQRPVLGPLGLLLAGAATLVTKLFVWR